MDGWFDLIQPQTLIYLTRPKVRHLNVATFCRNAGCLSIAPALWHGAATSHFSPREV